VTGPRPVRCDGAVPTLGVEEEFFLLRLDGRTAGIAPELLGALPPGTPVAAEFARCQVEARTGVCRDLATAGRELSSVRGVLARAAAERGARLVAAEHHRSTRPASPTSPTTTATGD
jgi:glutamate---cysteine ligase / carboxylate-amine ligase